MVLLTLVTFQGLWFKLMFQGEKKEIKYHLLIV